MEPEPRRGVQRPVRKINPTLVALIAGVVLVLGLILFFATGRDPDQDKLSDTQIAQNAGQPESPERRCSSKATYDLIKRDLFQRAAQVRGSDQEAYGKLAAFAAVRMENAVLESEDSASGALNCSASISLDLPPGVAVANGSRTLTADIDYTIDASGNVIVRNAEAIISPLSALVRVAETPAPDANLVAPEPADPLAPLPPNAVSPPQPAPVRTYPGRPSFDCSRAQTRGEIAVCSDTGLSALDVNMTREYRRALGAATPSQHALLQSTRNRFLSYRDSCPNRRCIADAYLGRMREIRDIMEGRLQPGR